jgi:hypothetical protein
MLSVHGEQKRCTWKQKETRIGGHPQIGATVGQFSKANACPTNAQLMISADDQERRGTTKTLCLFCLKMLLFIQMYIDF